MRIQHIIDAGDTNEKILLLPIDHGLEHGPSDFFANPDSLNPQYQFELAVKLKLNGIACHIGLAEKYIKKYAGKLPLILKINGKTNIPSDDEPISPLTASVEDAISIGADAIGYTLYVGSPLQHIDIRQFADVRKEASRFGIPIILWSYPRGKFIKEKGGKNSFYAVDYAARVAEELGSDFVKLNFPVYEKEKAEMYPKPYNTLDMEITEIVNKIVKSAGKVKVLFSGGSKISDNELLKRVEICMMAGANGFIIGRNVWQRSFDEAKKIVLKIKKIMKEY